MATPNHSISDFITKFGGGTRQNRFKITGSIYSNTQGGGSVPTFLDRFFQVRSATVPNSTLGGIPINYRGRTVVYPGERIYSPWQILILDDKPDANKGLFEAFHAWSNAINNHVDNITTATGLVNPNNHFANNTWTVHQLDVNGDKPVKKFNLYNCWPQAVGDIALDMGADNTLASFAVTIYYSHYSIEPNTTA